MKTYLQWKALEVKVSLTQYLIPNILLGNITCSGIRYSIQGGTHGTRSYYGITGKYARSDKKEKAHHGNRCVSRLHGTLDDIRYSGGGIS